MSVYGGCLKSGNHDRAHQSRISNSDWHLSSPLRPGATCSVQRLHHAEDQHVDYRYDEIRGFAASILRTADYPTAVALHLSRDTERRHRRWDTPLRLACVYEAHASPTAPRTVRQPLRHSNQESRPYPADAPG